MLKATLAPGTVEPQGNHNPRGAPWGVYPCDNGNERWCVITIRDDYDWRHVRAAIGDPEWARAHEYETARGRMRSRRNSIDAWRNGPAARPIAK